MAFKKAFANWSDFKFEEEDILEKAQLTNYKLYEGDGDRGGIFTGKQVTVYEGEN